MLSTLVLFGATSDLAGRLLLPALARLLREGQLADDFRLVGSAREEGDDASFREWARGSLAEHAPGLADDLVDHLVGRLSYVPGDATDPGDVQAVLDRAEGAAAVYLALPTGLVPDTARAVSDAGLAAGSRIAIEKPFGDSLAGAQQLNALLREVTGGDDPSIDVYRIDHALGLEALRRALALRFGDGALAGLWSADRIDGVEVLWEETLALEGRAGFYDATGALRDVLQNHAMQVFTMLAMEQPADASSLHEHKAALLGAVRIETPVEAAAGSRRGRYTAGRLADDADGRGRDVPSYVDEEGVDASRDTETFAEFTLHVDTPRWTGVPFVLRAGKALDARRKGVLLHLRAGEASGMFGTALGGRLWLGVDGPNDVRLELDGDDGAEAPLILRSEPMDVDLPPYAHVLRDILGGTSAHAVGAEEAETAWRVVEPVLEAWDRDLVPLEDYPAGSAGPGTH